MLGCIRMLEGVFALINAVQTPSKVFKRLLFLLALLHAYVGWRLLLHTPQAWMAWLLVVWLLVSLVLLPVGLNHRRLAAPPPSDWLAWAGFGALGLFSSLLMLTLARDGLASLAWMLNALGADLGEAAWAWTLNAPAVPVLALGMSAWGLYLAHRTPPVRRVRVPIKGLPPSLHGLKIAQISDVHVVPTLHRGFVERLVAQVNALETDLVAVTGDLVDGSVEELSVHLAPLANLRSRHGSFFVTGNYEYYAGCLPWLAYFRQLGLRVLLNEHVVLHAPGLGASVVLAGVTDWSAHLFERGHRSSPQKSLLGAPAQVGVRILLAHQPRSLFAAEQAGFDLQLSGHTHGGQIWPWSYLVYLQQPYRAGLHRHGRMWVYGHSGSGYWGPPQRLGAASEVALIELRRA